MQIDLRYEVYYNSSRSMIKDSLMGKHVAAPLFKRGVERDKFDKALTWLARDIDQLMTIRGLQYDRTKCMLANLNTLFVHEINPKLT